MDQSDYNQFLDLVYDAAVDPELWAPALTRFARLVGANSGVLIKQNEITGEGEGILANVDPTAMNLYYGHFATRNVLQKEEGPYLSARNWRATVVTDEHKMPKSELMQSEYYNDFMRRFEIHSLLILRLAILGMDAVSINMIRPLGSDQFDEAELKLSRALHPHMIRAFGLGQKIAGARILKDDIAGSLDNSPHALFLVDQGGRVRHLNRAAEAMTAQGDGLRLAAGKLTAARPEQARRLEGLIAAAAALDPDLRRGGSMAVPILCRRLPLSVTVAPVRVDRRSIFDGGPSVIVCASDLEAGARLPEHTVRDLFGLTSAEARVALALFEGLTPREAAEQIGVSFHTVRAQIASIYEKTGVSRQSELVRLMMRSVGVSLG
jgi:DNA-binding CsgD family transcriptional regulator